MATSRSENFDILNTESNQHELTAIVTIMITLLLHHVSVKLEQVLKRHKHLSEMLHHLYRELMVLGLISFGLFTLEKQRGSSLSHDTKATFENIHIMIFFIAFGYTVVTVLLMALSVRISKFWDGIEGQDHSSYLQIKNRFDEIREKISRMGLLSKIMNITLYFKHFNLVEQVSFHDLRLHFLHSNHLPPTFSFARYLRKCKSHVLLQLGDIHSSCWMTIIVVLMCDMLQRNMIPVVSTSPDYMLLFWRISLITVGALLCIIPISVLVKTRAILSEILCRSEMIDFDPVAARYYIDHWRDCEEAAPEQSLSYAIADGTSLVSNVHFTAESAVRRVARTYQIDHWGKTNSSPELLIMLPYSPGQEEPVHQPSELGIDEEPKLARVQSVHNVEFSQMNLFWFNSHVFMLRLMQVCQFLTVWYFAILFQFHEQLFGQSNFLMYGVAAVPLFVLLTCFAWTLPIYTIIIHVGQLVDLDIVLEARMKASKPSQDLTAVSVAPAQLRRTSTLMLLPKCERLKIQVSIIVFGANFQLALFWCILIQVTLSLLHYFPDLFLHPSIPYLTLVVPFLFMLEMGAKLYATGYKFFIRSFMVFFDLVIVLSTFVFSILQLMSIWVSPVATSICLLRIFQIIRASRLGRIMRHQQECTFEAKLGESEIEMQMKRTRDKILEAIGTESTQHRRGPSNMTNVEAQFALRRARTLPVSPLPTRTRTLKISLDDGEHIQVPVQAHHLTET